MSVYDGTDVLVHGDDSIAPITEFPGCGIRNDILHAVAEMGYKFPTNVQKYAIPYVLHGQDLIVTSQTGSGKTAAYMLPILSQVASQRPPGTPLVVVLVPTRELALQIEENTRQFTAQCGLKTICLFGGPPIGEQLRRLRSAQDILIATPGRLIDILERERLTLSQTQFLVLDEADRMLDMGFEPQIDQVINGYDMPGPDARQNLLFSATFPATVRSLAQRFMRPDVTRIEVGLQDAPALIEQRFVYCPDGSKFSRLLDIIGDVDGQTLVFAEMKVTVDRIEEYLCNADCPVVALHGGRDMRNRQDALRGFANGRAQLMIATDVAARGIDIPSVAHVINVDLPQDLDSYIHRIGRTGRAGMRGIATSLWNEGNTPFLMQLCAHYRANRQPIPAGLEEIARQRGPKNGFGRPQRSTSGYGYGSSWR